MVMYETSKPASIETEDSPAEATVHKAMARLPPASAGTIRIVDRSGGFFSAHGQDALWMAQNFYKTNSILKFYGAKADQPGTPYCNFSTAVACSFLRDALTSKQLRIQIYVKDGVSKVKLDKQASPGNLQAVESMLFNTVEILSAPIVAAIQFSIKANAVNVGVAYADSSSREIGISQFQDNESFSNVESFIIQLGVKEMLMMEAEKDEDAAKLRTLVERCNVVVTTRKKAEFKDTNIEQDLTRLVQDSDKKQLEAHYTQKEAMASCAALISYLSLDSDESNSGAFRLLTHDLAHYMRLDASAVKALHLMPDTLSTGNSNKNTSVFGVLNKCKTAQGTRLLAQWLKQPLVNLHEIEKRQVLVECMVDDTFMRQALQDDHLKTVPDLTRIVKKLTRGKASLQDVARVYQAVLRLGAIVECLRTAGGDSSNEAQRTSMQEEYVGPLSEFEAKLAPYSEMVETTLDLEELDRNNYVIRPEFSEDLQEVKTQLDDVKEQLDAEHEAVADDLGMSMDQKTLHFEKNDKHGWCFRLTRKEAGILTQGDNADKYIQLQTKNNGTAFITKKLRRLQGEHADLQAKYDKKQSGLVKEVVAIAASYCEVLLPLNALLAHLDVIVSLAHVAINAPTPYVKPKVSAMGEGDLILKESRHPCLEAQEDINFIPNDVELKRGESEFSILTGPNMGGKSTFIRQIGVIALMAQIGCFVPCSEAQVPIFDCILARVGAGDFQLRGVSTFMAEMIETATILKTATKNSLIIIDELGRGTSVQDGFGLAWSISEHIATHIRALCVFASHFHELCSLSERIPHVKNLHVIANVEENAQSLTGRDITLLYKVEPGSSDRSFGIAVAELAHFPPEVVKLAKRKANDLEAFETAVPKEADQCSPEDVAAGTAILRDMLVEWAASKPDVDEDVEMDGAEGDATQREAERQLKKLKSCFAEHREQLEGNPWLKALMAVED